MNNILSSAMRPRSFHHTCRNLSGSTYCAGDFLIFCNIPICAGAIPIPTALQDNIHQRMANRRRFYKNVGVEALPGDPGRPAIVSDVRVNKLNIVYCIIYYSTKLRWTEEHCEHLLGRIYT